MAVSRFNRIRLLLLLVALGAVQVWAQKADNASATGGTPLSSMSLEQLDEKLQVRLLPAIYRLWRDC